jgi:hypothetical protein
MLLKLMLHPKLLFQGQRLLHVYLNCSYIRSRCFRDRGCYMFTKTDATSLAAVPGTEVAIWSLKMMLHPYSCCSRDRGCYMFNVH